MDFKKKFDKFSPRKNEFLLPSAAIPREIERWKLYRKLVEQRSKKYLLKEKHQFIEFLYGDTFPLTRVYESNPNRIVDLNPLFSKKTQNFPLWENIVRNVECIGIDMKEGKEYPPIKRSILASLDAMITFLSKLNIKKLDKEIKKFDRNLKEFRIEFIEIQVKNRKLLEHYPLPTKEYIYV